MKKRRKRKLLLRKRNPSPKARARERKTSVLTLQMKTIESFADIKKTRKKSLKLHPNIEHELSFINDFM